MIFMIVRYFFNILLCVFIFSCQRELTQEEKDQISKGSINLIYLAMGMNADSSFSIIKYQKDLWNYQQTLLPLLSINPTFDDYTILFYGNQVYYYENPFKGQFLCGTGMMEIENNKMIAELYEVKKEDLKLIDSDTLIDFLNKIDIKNHPNMEMTSYLILAIEPEKLNSKSFINLRKYLLDHSYKYIIRPISTRERLVINSLITNGSDDFSNLDWDSIYKADFQRFYPNIK